MVMADRKSPRRKQKRSKPVYCAVCKCRLYADPARPPSYGTTNGARWGIVGMAQVCHPCNFKRIDEEVEK
jgi:hypothetical protein